MSRTHYTPEFFAEQGAGARRAAQVMVPMILDLAEPASVLDVGCGTGAFLAVAREHGVTDVLGVDGPWVNGESLLIPRDRLVTADLEAPLDLGRSFGLVLSLEVAEHLPAPAAGTFVASLTRHAPLVVFSAAVPNQGGTNHVNEQWPDYWVERFAERGYAAFDPFRLRIWNDEGIPPWYRQNTVLFVEDERLERDPSLAARLATGRSGVLSLVHPRLFEIRGRG